MALPYPGMDFTALDVLHAADLDKMVANIEYNWRQSVYLPGDTVKMTESELYWAGRQRVTGSKIIDFVIPLDRKIDSSVSSITFTMSGWCEAFGGGGQGTIISSNDSSKFTYTCTRTPNVPNLLRVKMTINDSGTVLQHNNCCIASVVGTFTFS